MQTIMRCVITNKVHPHYGKYGSLSGYVVKLKPNVELSQVNLDDGKVCFIKKGEAKVVPITHEVENNK